MTDTTRLPEKLRMTLWAVGLLVALVGGVCLFVLWVVPSNQKNAACYASRMQASDGIVALEGIDMRRDHAEDIGIPSGHQRWAAFRDQEYSALLDLWAILAEADPAPGVSEWRSGAMPPGGKFWGCDRDAARVWLDRWHDRLMEQTGDLLDGADRPARPA